MGAGFAEATDHPNGARRGRVWHWLGTAMAAGLLMAACGPGAAPSASPAGQRAPAEAAAPAAPGSSATGPAPAAPLVPERLRIVYPVISIPSLHVIVARDAGYYGAHGLDAELQFISGVPTVVAALLAGEIDVAWINPAPAIAASLQGADLVTIAQPITRYITSLQGRPEIRAADQLRGKRIGVVAIGGATDFMARQALRHLGLDPDLDASFIRTGGAPETLAALMAGAIDAGIVGHPLKTQAKRNGMVELLDLRVMDIEYPSASLVLSRPAISDRQEAVHRLLRVTAEATHRIKTDKDFTVDVLRRFTDVDDLESLEEGYRTMATVIREVPAPTRGAMQAVIDEVAYSQPAIREMDPEHFWDTGPVQRLEAEGFYRQVFGR